MCHLTTLFCRIGDSCRLDPEIYEMSLFEFLRQNDSQGFLTTLTLWPTELFSSQAMTKPLVEKLLIEPENEPLQRALAELYSRQGKHGKSVQILLKLGGKEVFDFVRTHALWSTAGEKVAELMMLDRAEAAKLFLERR